MIWFVILLALNTCGVATFPTREACEAARADLLQRFGAQVTYLSLCTPGVVAGDH
mgnify:CR=1 FL=1